MGSINVVTHNLQGMFSNRQLGIVTVNKKKSTEKLSSGYKINRAADDAAGLTISEKMRRMIRGLTQASANVQDGVSLCQVADGYLDEVHDMLHRTTELAVKGSNGTLTDADRKAIDEEVGALKSEMKRIFKVANFNEIPLFHVPYTPDITPPATDMELFHTGTGNTVGGLEFNNVRYNISELQAEGFKIDSDGVATEDFEVSFSLWDGETVDISMKEGDDLAQAKRNYKWTADENGISINNKVAADWSDVTGPDGGAVTDTSQFATGTYTFTYHGMTISFDIDEESALDDVMNGINGDEITKPATWDISVGGATSKSAASIVSGTQRINVTNANKDYIDHSYSVVADENGIAIKDDTASYTTGYTAWSDFKDNSANTTDENGNPVSTNGGYPIIDWGTDNDSNSESDITFDDTARYTYSTSDSSVPGFEFTFKLAESASLEEVSDSMSTQMTASKVYAPGKFKLTIMSNFGRIKVIDGANVRSLINDSTGDHKGDFALQEAYGRDFDNPNATLDAPIYVTRAIVGRNLADDTVNSDGTYSVEGHTLGNETMVQNNKISTSDPYDRKYTYYVVNDQYYRAEEYYEDWVYTRKYAISDSWTQDIEYTFTGDLNGTEMDPLTRSQKEYYERTIYRTGTETEKILVSKAAKKVSADSLTDEQKEGAIVKLSTIELPNVNYSKYKGTTVGDDFTASVTTASLTGLETGSYDLEFNSDKGKAFSFSYSINVDQAKTYNSTNRVRLGTITFQATDYAYRNFKPTTTGTISEAEFSNIQLNVPEKQLDIQAGANAGDIIRMTWSPLNLTILGMSGVNTTTEESSRASIAMVQNALDVISETRSKFGAYQNRFEHTIRNLDNVVENTQAAESLIRDTDMSKEMVKYAKENILEQVNSSILAQANQSTQGVLSLFS